MNWKRNLIGGLSFTTALFVFQACYGTPQDFGNDFLLEGTISDKSTGLPLANIKVTIGEDYQYAYTDSLGNFSLYTMPTDTLRILCSSAGHPSSTQYIDLDTLVTVGDITHFFVDLKMVVK